MSVALVLFLLSQDYSWSVNSLSKFPSILSLTCCKFMNVFWASFILFQVLDGARCDSKYRTSIPNGNRVPHPCENRSVWEDVGHQQSTGSSQLNPFGVDFKSSGFKWTKELCEKDSDGDGLTNGYELGDPNCTWTGGALQTPDTNLSHPGICQPINEPECELKQEWLAKVCHSEDFKCKAVYEPGVKKMKFQYPLIPVPNQETTLVCKDFDLSSIEDAHIISAKVIKGHMIHHSILFGCQTSNSKIKPDVYPCDMLPGPKCSTMIHVWSMGGKTSECFNEHSGFRIGRKGYQKLILQFHLNNPTLRSNYMVAPALQVHYTNKRKYDSGFFTIGPTYFEIPPKSPSAIIVGNCSGSCTSRYMKDKIYILSVFHHMHKFGQGGSIEIIRNGTKIRDITRDNYNNKVTRYFKKPIEVSPGDTLKITCIYNTMHRTNSVYFGNSSTDSEMCFGFISYYPESNFQLSYCVNYKSFSPCSQLPDYIKEDHD